MKHPEFLDKYQIVEELGRGGYGTVYKALHPDLMVYRAIKLLHSAVDPEQVKEAVLQARLEHERIVHVLDVGLYNERPFWVMEFMEGGSLEQLIAQGPLSLEQVFVIGRDLALGLAAAHDKGIIHRDLKPANVLLNNSGRAKMTDFGLARLSDGDNPLHTRVAGTVSYLAPEQLKGNALPQSDLWSLGCVLYEMACGQRAYFAQSDYEIMRAVAEGPIPDLEVLRHDELAGLIRGLMKKDPRQRPGRAQDVAKALAGMESYSGAPGQAPPPPTMEELEDWPMLQARPERTGAILPSLRPPLKEVWRYQSEAAISASPAICRGRLFCADMEGALIALDLLTGKTLWRYQAQGAMHPSPVAFGTAALFCSSRGEVYALDAGTGSVIWRTSLGHAVSATPLLSHTGVFIADLEGGLNRLDPVDGHIQTVWPGPEPIEASLLEADGRIIWINRNGLVRVLDAGLGEITWSLDLEMTVEAPPACQQGSLFILGREGVLVSLDAVSGSPRFRCDLGSMAVAAPVVDHNRVICVLLSGEVVCLDSVMGHERWRCDLGAAVSAAPALGWQNLVVCDRSSGVTICSREGKRLFRLEMHAPIAAAPVIWRDLVLACDLSGLVKAWGPEHSSQPH